MTTAATGNERAQAVITAAIANEWDTLTTLIAEDPDPRELAASAATMASGLLMGAAAVADRDPLDLWSSFCFKL